MKKTKIIYKDYITDIMDNTGVKYRQGQRKTGDWIFLPVSNLKFWTKEECNIIEKAILDNNLFFTYDLYKSNGDSYTVERGKGLRIVFNKKED